MEPTKIRKGIFYWNTYENARAWAKAHGWPTNRIIGYEVGYAIQENPSGDYAGPSNFVEIAQKIREQAK